MTEPTDARRSFGDLAPHLAEMTDKTLFGEVWADPALSPRDRSLITITSLISLYRGNELPFHLQRALDNGLTRAEIIATISGAKKTMIMDSAAGRLRTISRL